MGASKDIHQIVLSPLEKETNISFNESDPKAEIYTHNQKWVGVFERLSKDHPEECQEVRKYPDGARKFAFPKKWLKPPKAPRTLTEAEKQERMIRLRGRK